MIPTTQAILFETDADREAAASWLAANIPTATVQEAGPVENTNYYHLKIAFQDIEDAKMFYAAPEVVPYEPPVEKHDNTSE